jgi:hypothetical protein
MIDDVIVDIYPAESGDDDRWAAGEGDLPVAAVFRSMLISHNMPHGFEVADRIHIQRLGRCAGVATPRSRTMEIHDRRDHAGRNGPA